MVAVGLGVTQFVLVNFLEGAAALREFLADVEGEWLIANLDLDLMACALPATGRVAQQLCGDSGTGGGLAECQPEYGDARVGITVTHAFQCGRTALIVGLNVRFEQAYADGGGGQLVALIGERRVLLGEGERNGCHLDGRKPAPVGFPHYVCLPVPGHGWHGSLDSDEAATSGTNVWVKLSAYCRLAGGLSCLMRYSAREALLRLG